MPNKQPPILALVLIAGVSLTHQAPAADKKVTYQDHVRAVFENRCFNCHNPDKAKGGLDLTTYTNAMAGGSSGEVLVPGNANDSRLFRSVSHIEDPKMPPKGDKLPVAELDLIASWINAGVLETSSSTARKPKKPAFDLTAKNAGAGRPEGPPPVPEHLLLDPPTVTARASAQAAIASSPWAPVVALTGQKQVLLYNSDNHQLAGILPFPEGFPQSLSFSRNGSLLLAAGGRGGKSGRVVVWDVKSGRRVIELGNEFDTILAADITSDHALVALGGPSRRIKIYNTSDGSELISIKKHTDWITSMAFSPDGVLLATGDRNGGLFVWESGTGNPFYTLKGHSKAITSITWRDDSNIVASASEDGTIRLWEMNGGNQVKNWSGHGGGITDLDFTHDGHLVSTGRDRHAKIWDQGGATIKDVTGFSDIPLAAAFSHDGKKFITGDWAGIVTAWDSATGKKLTDLSANPPAIAARLSELQKQIAAQEPAVAAASKKHGDLAATLAPIESRGNEAQKQIEALSAKRAGADAELQAARKAIAEATTARDQADEANKPVHAERLKQANAALGAATGKLGELDKQLADANAALAKRQEELKVTREATDKAKAELDTAAKALSNIKTQQQFWQAAQINTRRLAKQEVLTKQTIELEYLKEDLAAAETAVADAQSQIAAAESAAAAAPGIIEAKQNGLNEAKAKLPAIDTKLRLTAIILENKRSALEALNEFEPKTPELAIALVAATQQHGDAQARQNAEKAEKSAAEKAIQTAQAELENAHKAQAATTAAIAAAKASLVTAHAKQAELQQSEKAQQSQLAQSKTETDSLLAQYQSALPKGG